jgi:hypothetical protein
LAIDERFTEANFSKHLNTAFLVKNNVPKPVELKLIEVKGYEASAKDQGGMERFSLYFKGPSEFHLPQSTYEMEHEQLGSLDIFIATISQDEQGFTYEAVFNFFR